MKLDMEYYNRLIEITGGSYKANKTSDEDSVMFYDSKSAIEDLITEFDVIEESYVDLKDKILNKLNELKEHKFMIDMIDRWSDGEKYAWDLCVDQIKLLEGILDDREQERNN